MVQTVRKRVSNDIIESSSIVYDTQQLNLWYGNHHALKNINLTN